MREMDKNEIYEAMLNCKLPIGAALKKKNLL